MRTASARRLLAACLLAASACLPAAAQVPQKKTNLTKADRAAWHQFLKWPEEFEERWRKTRGGDADGDGGLVFHDLGRKRYLVEINIFGGAYQPGYIFVIYDESRPTAGPSRPLNFKHYERDTRGRVTTYFDPEMLGFFTFDEQGKTLEVFSKSRGPGDCGSLVKYRFVGERPVPVEARAQPCYDDTRRQVTDPRRWQKVTRL